MKRREFIGGSAAILADMISQRAGAAAAWRIGQVFGGSPEIVSSSGLEQGLAAVGYVDGKNIRLQTRFVGPHPNEMKAAVLALLPDIDLLVVWGTIGGVAAKAAMPNSDQAHDVAYCEGFRTPQADAAMSAPGGRADRGRALFDFW